MFLLVSNRFLRFFTRGFASAITLWPFIILSSKRQKLDQTLLNHERIHLAQQIECGIIFFYLIYIFEYCYYRYKKYNNVRAYQSISFEKEAYAHECEFDYLTTRKWYSFIKYW
jgi:hypothetical protein